MIITTIIVAVFLTWNFICLYLSLDDDSYWVHKYFPKLYDIARIYRIIFGSLLIIGIILAISSVIALPIWCGISNNDDEVCEVLD